MDSIEWRKEKVKRYYKQKKQEVPPDFQTREFGFGDQKKIDYRHISFNTEDDFYKFFIERAPLYASYSIGYYEFPSARPMSNKQMVNADLVFEFDAECSHDTLACYKCLDWAKDQTFKLIEDFLIADFGFSKKEIKVSFSGNRGYHIHVRSKDAKKFGKKARKELIDYLQMKKFDFNRLIKGATLESQGWKGKVARDIYDFLKTADDEVLKEVRFMPKTRERILNRKEEILKGIEAGNFDQLRNAKNIWEKISEKNVIKLNADIDQSVTMDMARLIRIPSTIHSSTGFLDMYIDDLEKFDPFSDPIVFMNFPEKIKFTQDVAEFTLKGQTFGPYKKDQETELPEYAAFFCVGKNVALP